MENIYADHVEGSDGLDKGLGRDWSRKDWFKIPSESLSTFLSQVYRSSATRSFCFTVAVPLFDNLEFAGVLGIDINFKDLISI